MCDMSGSESFRFLCAEVATRAGAGAGAGRRRLCARASCASGSSRPCPCATSPVSPPCAPPLSECGGDASHTSDASRTGAAMPKGRAVPNVIVQPSSRSRSEVVQNRTVPNVTALIPSSGASASARPYHTQCLFSARSAPKYTSTECQMLYWLSAFKC